MSAPWAEVDGLKLHHQAGPERDTNAASRKLVNSMLGMAKRDFSQGLNDPQSVTSGAQRTLWAGRAKGWFSRAELAEFNSMLNRMQIMLGQTRSDERAHLLAFAWVTSPQRSRPRRARGGLAFAQAL